MRILRSQAHWLASVRNHSQTLREIPIARVRSMSKNIHWCCRRNAGRGARRAAAIEDERRREEAERRDITDHIGDDHMAAEEVL